MKRQKHIISLLCVALLTGCMTSKWKPQSLTPALQQAYSQILSDETWIDGNVYGFAGESENKSATAIRALLTSAEADVVFLRLVRNAKPAGQLYALCGLYYADHQRFLIEIERFRKDARTVRSVSADVIGEDKISDIVFCPYPPRMSPARTCPESCENAFLPSCSIHPSVQKEVKRAVLKPGQTLKQWVEENDTDAGFYSDISGGGMPSTFRNIDFGW